MDRSADGRPGERAMKRPGCKNEKRIFFRPAKFVRFVLPKPAGYFLFFIFFGLLFARDCWTCGTDPTENKQQQQQGLKSCVIINRCVSFLVVVAARHTGIAGVFRFMGLKRFAWWQKKKGPSSPSLLSLIIDNTAVFLNSEELPQQGSSSKYCLY